MGPSLYSLCLPPSLRPVSPQPLLPASPLGRRSRWAFRIGSINALSDRGRWWPSPLLGLLALIVVSVLAAQRKADIAYVHLDSLKAQYRDVETACAARSGLHLSGILVRDYLLDSSTPPAEYRSR